VTATTHIEAVAKKEDFHWGVEPKMERPPQKRLETGERGVKSPRTAKY